MRHPRTQIVVCACGAESEPSEDDNWLTMWEGDHTQFECTAVVGWRWEPRLKSWLPPSLPAMTRYDVDPAAYLGRSA
ncbi:hypothetical protein FB384_004919 [Prauserella sediminis]|uniref:Uncharacterized protein n=1 Tax=Prauserella sediminis TaxID=577680 RepID=A0A839XS06_9PSEU|nr:hypothetical protein [Prauserella sediminis]MBB3665960.1 hypothetical protein [Prauserella sediminis]